MSVDDDVVKDWEARIAWLLRNERRRQQLSMSELSRRADVSEASIRSFEGGAGVNLRTMLRLIIGLGREDWLAGFTEPALTDASE